MKIVLQRVREASVSVQGQVVGRIGQGLVLFVGIARTDSEKEAVFLADKVLQLRVFDDAGGRMNISALDQKAGLLVVSQFTLCGRCEKGRRPSFDEAADPEKARVLYEFFVDRLRHSGLTVETGQFRAMMDVALVNDGPVTLILEKSYAPVGHSRASGSL